MRITDDGMMAYECDGVTMHCGGRFEWLHTSGKEKTGALCIQGYGTVWRLNVSESSDDCLTFSNKRRDRVPAHCVIDLTDVTNRARMQSCIVYKRIVI